MVQSESEQTQPSGVHFSRRLVAEISGREEPGAAGQSPEARPPPALEQRTADGGSSVPGLPAGLYAVAPALSPAEDERGQQRRQELASIRQVLSEIEEVRSRLQVGGDTELRRIASLAQELQGKQRRAPWRPTPCEEEKASCIQCYKEHSQGMVLDCAKAVSQFLECARRARQEWLDTSVQ